MKRVIIELTCDMCGLVEQYVDNGGDLYDNSGWEHENGTDLCYACADDGDDDWKRSNPPLNGAFERN